LCTRKEFKMEPPTASMMPQPPAYENTLPGQEDKPKQEWMPTPAALPGCPPGLEYLALLDKVLIHQQIDLADLVMRNQYRKTKYVIKNSVGQQCYFAYEESDNCQQCCCGIDRAFVMKIVDNANMEVMRVIRAAACCRAVCCGGCWCAGCWPEIVKVESPPGTHVATIEQCGTFCATNYIIKDPSGKTIFHLNGPSCVGCRDSCCHKDTKMKVCTPDDDEIGMLKKVWSGLAQEMCSVTNFEASFPQDLDVKMKAAIMGTSFLLGLKYFENVQQPKNRR